jgi:hypothetical protein
LDDIILKKLLILLNLHAQISPIDIVSRSKLEEGKGKHNFDEFQAAIPT